MKHRDTTLVEVFRDAEANQERSTYYGRRYGTKASTNHDARRGCKGTESGNVSGESGKGTKCRATARESCKSREPCHATRGRDVEYDLCAIVKQRNA
jgi:hypothetical protein